MCPLNLDHIIYICAYTPPKFVSSICPCTVILDTSVCDPFYRRFTDLFSLGRYLCRRTIRPREYHPVQYLQQMKIIQQCNYMYIVFKTYHNSLIYNT
jgi:hypothetical protein